MCRCNKRFSIGDMQAIGERLIELNKLQSTAPTISGEEQTMNFVGRMLAGGAARANVITSSDRLCSYLPSNVDVFPNLFCDGAAEAAIRMSGNNLSSEAIQAMQCEFG